MSGFPQTLAHAVAVFGSEAKALDWLASPCGALADRTPARLLEQGRQEDVETELGCIEYGIYV
jgi:uncharacterized protein (DUF2384 family)